MSQTENKVNLLDLTRTQMKEIDFVFCLAHLGISSQQ